MTDGLLTVASLTSPTPNSVNETSIVDRERGVKTLTPSVFVSYRREDSKHAAGRLAAILADRCELFMDVESIEAGSDFSETVRRSLDSSDVLLALIGSAWLTSTDADGSRRIDASHDWVALEISTALRRDIPVIPVLLDGVAMPSRVDLPATLAGLADRQAVRVDHETFVSDCLRLIDAIDGALSQVLQSLCRSARSPC